MPTRWNNYAEAKEALQKIFRQLERINPSAGRSLEEGLEETLTVDRLGVGAVLRRKLSTSNPIESCLSTVQRVARNVKRCLLEETHANVCDSMSDLFHDSTPDDYIAQVASVIVQPNYQDLTTRSARMRGLLSLRLEIRRGLISHLGDGVSVETRID
jgi:hypothetical protein